MYYPPNQPPQYPPQPEQYQQSSGWQQPSYPPHPEQYQQPPEWQSRQSYPYQQPQYTPPPPIVQPPAPKKSRKKLFAFGCGGLVALVVLIAVIAAAASSAGSSSNTNTTNQAAQPTATQLAQQATQAAATLTAVPTQAPPSPTAVPKWTTTHSFTGNGIQKTAVFTVADDWKLNWSCTPSSFYGGSYNVQVYVYGSDGSLVDVAINTICQAGNVSGSTEEHQGGDIYLDMESEGAWTVQVQELK